MAATLIKQIFKRDSIQTIPWVNGGGITREIAASGPDEGFWRLSIADVATEGAFSSFPGLHRILTVIEGEGIILRSPQRTLHASTRTPISFSGEDNIVSSLPNGPIQDFNLIFDPAIWDGQVNVGTVEEVTPLHWDDADISALYCLDGSLTEKSVGELQPTWGALLKPGALDIEGPDSCHILCVDLRLKH